MSEKSILAARRPVGRTLPAARPARADDADRLGIASPPAGIRHHEDATRDGLAEAQVPGFLPGMPHIRPVKGIKIAEHAGRLLE
jgi:hypothetical protein